MLKRLIGLSLLCAAGHSYAGNIIVNTTEDDNAANDKCSLREAIALVNMKGTDGKIPEAGYQGCIGKDASSIIVLESGKTYKVNQEIPITQSVTVLSLPAEKDPPLSYKGEKNAIIKAIGTHRLFNIDDGKPNVASIIATFEEVDMVGCAADNAATICAANGGLIYNIENLTINYSRLSGAHAQNGGAIFNDGLSDNNNTTNDSAGILTLTNVFMASNIAELQGAAVYSAQPRYAITSSVFKENKVANNLVDASVVYVKNPVTVPSDTDVSSIARKAQITNSVFFHNDAFAANLRDIMAINNSTIVRNRGGVYLNAQSAAANLSNSIVAENTQADCRSDALNKATTNNLLFSKDGCNLDSSSTNPNIKLDPANPLHQLFANSKIGGGENIEGACDKAGQKGLLCPFNTEKEVFTGYFKPRLLTDYYNISESPIVNRGRVNSDGTTTNTLSCASTDQRGKTRDVTVFCDIGSIELTVSDPKLVGQDLSYNQIAEIDLTDNLGDGELWPASECGRVFPTAPADTVWQEGCMTFAPGKPAKKGSLLLNADALLKYTPFSNFHGLDSFSLSIVTTTSRFSQGDTNKTVIIPANIVMSPPDTFENKTVKTSGGSIGLLTVFGLFGLAWTRRRLQGE